jgi:hypothetical protein
MYFGMLKGRFFQNAMEQAKYEFRGGLPDITTHVQLAVEQDGIECTLLQV